MEKLTKKYIKENGVFSDYTEEVELKLNKCVLKEYHTKISIEINGNGFIVDNYSYISKKHSLELAVVELQCMYLNFVNKEMGV